MLEYSVLLYLLRHLISTFALSVTVISLTAKIPQENPFEIKFTLIFTSPLIVRLFAYKPYRALPYSVVISSPEPLISTLILSVPLPVTVRLPAAYTPY